MDKIAIIFMVDPSQPFSDQLNDLEYQFNQDADVKAEQDKLFAQQQVELEALRVENDKLTKNRMTNSNGRFHGAISRAMEIAMGLPGQPFTTSMIVNAARSAGSKNATGAAGQFLIQMKERGNIRHDSSGRYTTIKAA